MDDGSGRGWSRRRVLRVGYRDGGAERDVGSNRIVGMSCDSERGGESEERKINFGDVRARQWFVADWRSQILSKVGI